MWFSRVSTRRPSIKFLPVSNVWASYAVCLSVSAFAVCASPAKSRRLNPGSGLSAYSMPAGRPSFAGAWSVAMYGQARATGPLMFAIPRAMYCNFGKPQAKPKWKDLRLPTGAHCESSFHAHQLLVLCESFVDPRVCAKVRPAPQPIVHPPASASCAIADA